MKLPILLSTCRGFMTVEQISQVSGVCISAIRSRLRKGMKSIDPKLFEKSLKPGISNKRKGKAAELELAKDLSELMGVEIVRNLSQNRDGGYDLKVEGWAVEVKRSAETIRIKEWWEQALASAEAVGLLPLLAYRLDRRPWRFVLRLKDVMYECNTADNDMVVETGIMEIPIILKRKKSANTVKKNE